MEKFIGEINGKHFYDARAFDDVYFEMLKRGELPKTVSYHYEEETSKQTAPEAKNDKMSDLISKLYGFISDVFMNDKSVYWLDNVTSTINQMENEFKELKINSDGQLRDFLSSLSDVIESTTEDIAVNKDYNKEIEKQREEIIKEWRNIEKCEYENNKEITINNLIVNMLTNVKEFLENNHVSNNITNCNDEELRLNGDDTVALIREFFNLYGKNNY